jgi:hypothetical protein
LRSSAVDVLLKEQQEEVRAEGIVFALFQALERVARTMAPA